MGFKEEFDTKEWKTKEAQEAFKKQVTPLLEEMFPGAKVLNWTGFLFRGGEGENPGAVDGLHLDSYPDWDQVKEYNSYGQASQEEMDAFTPSEETFYIGLWKPINMKNPVLDHPLAIMDSSTLRRQDITKLISHMEHIESDGTVVGFKNLGGHVRYHEDQRIYYYPEMTNDEMIVFTHMGQNCESCCPHLSFNHPGAPTDKNSFDTRTSMETRIIMHYPKAGEE